MKHETPRETLVSNVKCILPKIKFKRCTSPRGHGMEEEPRQRRERGFSDTTLPSGVSSLSDPSLDLTALSWEVGCGAPFPLVKCDENSPYRTITGDCNNR